MQRDQGMLAIGSKLPVPPTMPQKQEPQPDGTGLPVQAVVPKDQARIRVQLSAAHTRGQLDKAIAAFVKVGKKLGVIK